MSGQLPPKPAAMLLPPPSTAVRQRLQQVFDHAQKCAERNERDYANDLFTQCVVEDPGNLIYLQHFLTNLANKYGNNKTGARLAGMKIRSGRAALVKAAGKGEWRAAFEAAADALKINPWDAQTLMALADVCQQIGNPETEIFLLRWALDVDPKDPVVNRRAAIGFGRLGQFDNAIGCWRRVLAAKPLDEEAARAVSQLSVEQTIKKGGYQQEMLDGSMKVADMETAVRASMARGRKEVSEQMPARGEPGNREQELLEALQSRPAEVSNYLELAELFTSQDRLQDAERILAQAQAVTGGGDLNVRECLEDAQLARVHQQVDIANRRAEQEKTDEAAELARRMAIQANLVELEIYGARSARDPGNTMLLYELGLRAKRAGKFKGRSRHFRRPGMTCVTGPRCSSIWANHSSTSGSSSWPCRATRRPSRLVTRCKWTCKSWHFTGQACWPRSLRTSTGPKSISPGWHRSILATGTWPTGWTSWPSYAIVCDSPKERVASDAAKSRGPPIH
jgi:tetratricopeptide (TPR) repeat protein